MGLFKCDWCGHKHYIQDDYDRQDYVCDNNENWAASKSFNNLTPTDLFTRDGWNYNMHSTKEDVTIPFTVVNPTETVRGDGEPIGSIKKNY